MRFTKEANKALRSNFAGERGVMFTVNFNETLNKTGMFMNSLIKDN